MFKFISKNLIKQNVRYNAIWSVKKKSIKHMNSKYTWAMCFAVIRSIITNDVCHPSFKPNISINPSLTCASINRFCKKTIILVKYLKYFAKQSINQKLKQMNQKNVVLNMQIEAWKHNVSLKISLLKTLHFIQNYRLYKVQNMNLLFNH